MVSGPPCLPGQDQVEVDDHHLVEVVVDQSQVEVEYQDQGLEE
jgi:hypothetical protein